MTRMTSPTVPLNDTIKEGKISSQQEEKLGDDQPRSGSRRQETDHQSPGREEMENQPQRITRCRSWADEVANETEIREKEERNRRKNREEQEEDRERERRIRDRQQWTEDRQIPQDWTEGMIATVRPQAKQTPVTPVTKQKFTKQTKLAVKHWFGEDTSKRRRR